MRFRPVVNFSTNSQKSSEQIFEQLIWLGCDSVFIRQMVHLRVWPFMPEDDVGIGFDRPAQSANGMSDTSVHALGNLLFPLLLAKEERARSQGPWQGWYLLEFQVVGRC